MLRKLLDQGVVRLANYLRRAGRVEYSLVHELERRVAAECADFIEQHMAHAIQFASREQLWDYTLRQVRIEGQYLEFGVFEGRSINHIARAARTPQRSRPQVYGFDSFEGLKEDWRGNHLGKGAFDRGGRMPRVEANVTLVKGWFDQTLPKFLAEHREPVAYLHIDSDTFEAADAVLSLLGDRIAAGSIVVFDEYFGYRGWKEGEHRAWTEFAAGRNVGFEYIAFTATQVAVRVVTPLVT
jgi:hypothetical protein